VQKRDHPMGGGGRGGVGGASPKDHIHVPRKTAQVVLLVGETARRRGGNDFPGKGPGMTSDERKKNAQDVSRGKKAFFSGKGSGIRQREDVS